MKLWNRTVDQARLAAWFIGVAGTFLIVGWLAWFIVQRTRPPGVDQARAALRAKNLAELQAENHVALTSYGWLDPTKGIVRLPVSRALELTLQNAADPAGARSNLIARLQKATAKAPEKPNEYE